MLHLWNRDVQITLVVSLIFISAGICVRLFVMRNEGVDAHVKVGFVMDGDESTPYSYGFSLAQYEVEKEFGEAVETVVRNNVHYGTEGEVIDGLVAEGCDIIFTNSYGYGVITKEKAQQYPHVQFCQATCDNANAEPFCKNYHTFMGEIYEGRYVAGIVAGLKLRELIDTGVIAPEEAKVGYVGAYPYAEVISGYTAFLLGIRSVAPEARMFVRYTNTWNSFSIEKDCARRLLDEGCVVISQHSDTIGPAVACEETYPTRAVYHVGYNQSMIDVAPLTSLVSTRINWVPYITGAVRAVLQKRAIEKTVRGHIHGNDIGAGFEADWVQMLELNAIIAAPGTQEKIDAAVQAFRRGWTSVFVGNYTGVNPYDASDICDLRSEYRENDKGSAPSFHYILDGVVTVEE